MHDGLVDQTSKFKKRVASENVSDYKVVEHGQLVVGFPIDEGVLDFQLSYDAGIVSPAYGIWDLIDANHTDRAYLKRFLRCPQAMSYYRMKLRGSTARRRSLPSEVFLKLPVPILPIEEQRRAAIILDQAESVRAERYNILTGLEALRQSIFLDMFGPVEAWTAAWPMGVIGDMVESVQYGTSAKAGEVGSWPILRMGNVTDAGRLDLKNLKYIDLAQAEIAKYTTRRGDLLFNRTNSKEKVGKSCVVDTDRPFAIAGYLVRARFHPQHQSGFVCAYLTSSHGRAVRQRLAKAAVNQANINAKEMQRIAIALPPTTMQEEFVRSIDRVNDECVAVECTIAADDELFASLQSRAFRGEL